MRVQRFQIIQTTQKGSRNKKEVSTNPLPNHKSTNAASSLLPSLTLPIDVTPSSRPLSLKRPTLRVLQSITLQLLAMFKSDLNSTDIQSEQSDSQDQMVLRIESADQKWAHFFLQAQASDLKIRHRQLLYPAHRNIIFKHINLHALELQTEEGVLEIPKNFNPQLVQGVLSCLYSLQLKICRGQVLQILDIVHCLHIAKLKRKIQEDIQGNFEEYEIFPLLQKALDFQMGEVKELCLAALENQSYEQVRYSKYDLLNCNQQTLKFVVAHHNERRWEEPCFGLSSKYMQQVINEYCKHNSYSEKGRNKLVKQLGDMAIRNQLPSFNKIKVRTLGVGCQSQSPLAARLYTPRSCAKDHSFNSIKMSEPPFLPGCSSTKSLIIDLTDMGDRKRKISRSSDNNNSQFKFCSDIINLKDGNRETDKYMEKLYEVIEELGSSLKLKEGEHRNMVFKVGEVESMLEESQRQLMQQNKQLLLLDVKLNKIIMNKISESQAAFDQEFQNIRGSNSSAESEEQAGKARDVEKGRARDIEKGANKKAENKKDENLRVSLIQSKWVRC